MVWKTLSSWNQEECLSAPRYLTALALPVRRQQSKIRLRNRLKPARPYICLFNILMRLTLPSTGPELKGRLSPAVTAARSSGQAGGVSAATEYSPLAAK